MEWLWIIAAVLAIFGITVFFGAPYVPSQKRYIDRAFTDLYKLGRDDVLVDVGSGDGVVLRAASYRGARAIGYEINPFLVLISRFLSRGDKRVNIAMADFWHAKLPPDTTVVYAFSVSRDGGRMMRMIQSEATRLGRTIHFINYGNPLRDLKPDKTLDAYYLYSFHPLQLS